MRIKHKLTGEELTIQRRIWDSQYLPKKLNEVYEIIEEDTVQVRRILDNGERKNLGKFDRDHAFRMVRSDPMKYDFIEIESDLTEDEKIEAVLRELNDAYPGYLFVRDFIAKRFKSSMREEQILVDRLLEEGLAKFPEKHDHRRMQITILGRQVISNDGYLRSKQKESEFEKINDSKGKFTEEERESIYERFDKLAEKLERLEVGQQITYDDLMDEIAELKKLTTILNKKTWGQTLKGKLLDWAASGLTEEAINVITASFKNNTLLLDP